LIEKIIFRVCFTNEISVYIISTIVKRGSSYAYHILVFILMAATSIGAQQVLVPNVWTDLSVASEKTVLPGPGGSTMYYGLAVTPLSAGSSYTLFVEWYSIQDSAARGGIE